MCAREYPVLWPVGNAVCGPGAVRCVDGAFRCVTRSIPVCDPGYSGVWPGEFRYVARGIPVCGLGQSGVWPVGSPVCSPGEVRRVSRGIPVCATVYSSVWHRAFHCDQVHSSVLPADISVCGPGAFHCVARWHFAVWP